MKILEEGYCVDRQDKRLEERITDELPKTRLNNFRNNNKVKLVTFLALACL